MRCWIEPKYSKYIEGHGFLPFARKFGDKYGIKLMDTGTKTEKNDAKTASERVIEKTAEATGGLSGNKKADKITSVGKTNSGEKKTKQIKNKKLTYCQKKDSK